MDLLLEVQHQLNNSSQWHFAKRIVLAISGGVDSMVLLYLMTEVNQRLPEDQRKEFFIAHFDHHLREDSDLDADLIRKVAKEYNLPYFFGEWSQPAERDVESQARNARYAFLGDVVKMTDSDTVMTGHHSNDLAETMIMRLIRGTSLRGLGGIRSEYHRVLNDNFEGGVRVQLVRPLIFWPKDTLYQYAHQHQIPYREDYTNLDDHFVRNRIRQRIVPEMLEINPKFLDNMSTLSDQLYTSYRVHLENYLKIEPELLQVSPQGYFILNVPRWQALSQAELHVYLGILFDERLRAVVEKYSKSLIEQMIDLLMRQQDANIQVDIASGWVAQRSYQEVYIYQLQMRTSLNEMNEIKRVPINEWVRLYNDDFVGVFEIAQLNKLLEDDRIQYYYEMTYQQYHQLKIRHRHPGDRLKVASKQGKYFHKKIARLMIDRKVPRNERELYWMFLDDADQIIATVPPLSHPIKLDTLKPETELVLAYKKKYRTL